MALSSSATASSPMLLFRSLLKERFLIALGLLTGIVLLAIYWVFFHVPTYESSAKLYVRNIQKENVIRQYGGGSTVRSESGYSNPLFNYLQILESQKLAARLYEPYTQKYSEELNRFSVYSLPKWYRLYPKLVRAKVIPSTDIIKVSFQWSDAESSPKALQGLIDEFKSLNLGILNQTGGSRLTYLEGELKRIDDELTETRDRIQRFQVAEHAVDLDNELESLTKMRVRLEEEGQLLRSKIEFSKQKYARLANQLNLPDATAALKATGVGTDPYLVRLRDDLAALQQKYANGLTKMTEKHPDIIAIKSQLMLMERQIADRQAVIVGDATRSNQFPGIYDKAASGLVGDFARTEADLVSQQAQLQSLEQSITAIRTQEGRIPAKKVTMEHLSKKEKALSNAYDDVLNSLMEASLKEKQVSDNIEVLSEPSKAKPVLLPVAVKAFAFILFGLLIGLTLAWFKRDIQDNWANADEMSEHTAWPLLGVVPWMDKLKDDDHSAKASRSLRDMSYVQLTDLLVNRTYAGVEPGSQAQWLSFVSPVASRSSNPTISNVAAQLVNRGKRVMVIELEPHIDYRKSLMVWREGQHEFTDLISHLNERIHKEGASSAALVRDEVMQACWEVSHPALSQSEGRFYYLPKTRQRVFIDDLIASPGFAQFMQVLKGEVDFVLMDLPAKPWVLPDMSHVLRQSDGVVVVTPLSGHRKALMKGVEQLKRLGANVLGVIAREKIGSIDRYMKQSA